MAYRCPLVPDAARRALSRTAQEMGAAFDDDALTRLAEAADGYPSFLPEYGKVVWDVDPAVPSPEHGRIAYTVPGMADFIRRQFTDQP